MKKLALCVADRPDMELDLTGDLSQLKKHTFVIKEGVSYRIRIDFIVQREIVHGLKYVQKTYRLGVPGMIFFPLLYLNIMMLFLIIIINSIACVLMLLMQIRSYG